MTAPSPGSVRALIDAMGSEWPKIREAEHAHNLVGRHRFSPLRSISIKETDHSRLLGGLLDPSGDHHEGPLFLHAFLEHIDIEEPARGTWRVTIEARRVDILLVREEPFSVVIVENKARGAVDQPSQLYRYWFNEIFNKAPKLDYADAAVKRRFKIIYAPAGEFIQVAPSSLRRPADLAPYAPEHELLPLTPTYHGFRPSIAPWLQTMAGRVTNPRLQTFINLYAEIWLQ